jgi:hypothetical protein
MKEHAQREGVSLRRAMGRRRFLRNLLWGLAAAGTLRRWPTALRAETAGDLAGLPEDFDFVFTRLQFSDTKRPKTQWNLDWSGDRHFAENLRRLVNIRVPSRPPPRTPGSFTRIADLADREQVLRYPFLFMTDNLTVSLPAREKAHLKEFLERGGFLYADDCVHGNRSDYFFRSVIATMQELFPGSRMERIPGKHPIHSCYFRLADAPFFQGIDHGPHGLYLDGRLAVYLTPGDIHCAWCQPQEQWFGPGSFQRAVKLGVNIVVFALTQQGRIRAPETPSAAGSAWTPPAPPAAGNKTA